jgi:CheY-like chemotaxis protein
MDEQNEERQKPSSILVVDDEPAVRELVREILEGGGYEVLTACNGREAMKVLRRNLVDLVITDLVMPEQEGIETIRAIHRGQPGLKILAMSGSAAPHLSTALKLGAHDSIQKPFSIEALLATVERLLSRQSAASQ